MKLSRSVWISRKAIPEFATVRWHLGTSSNVAQWHETDLTAVLIYVRYPFSRMIDSSFAFGDSLLIWNMIHLLV
jgi:hypothetical protein